MVARFEQKNFITIKPKVFSNYNRTQARAQKCALLLLPTLSHSLDINITLCLDLLINFFVRAENEGEGKGGV
jgi:hypothetical protein